MSINTTPVSRCLDNKLLIMGYEVPDLLAIFLLLALLNFVFGSVGGWMTLAIWGAPLALAAVLRYGKRGRPDNFLLHVARFHFSQGIYCAFSESRVFLPPPKLKGECY